MLHKVTAQRRGKEWSHVRARLHTIFCWKCSICINVISYGATIIPRTIKKRTQEYIVKILKLPG
jgi:epoxyqueuosine reductase QueG